jgi:hypothetical protein
LALIIDPNEEMSEFAKFVLKKTLQTKYKGFLTQHFAEAIIVFNNCTSHPMYKAMAAIGSDGDDSSAVSMEGIELDSKQRATIYEFMLEDITEEQKIQITANLSQDVLGYALETNIRPTPSATVNNNKVSTPLESVLEDVFSILSSPFLRVGKKGVNSAADGDDDDIAMTDDNNVISDTKTALHNAKTKVLKKLSVMHLIEHLLPVVCSLKHVLESCKSPVQKSLMEYLMYLMKTNKAEVTQTLSTHPGLKDEIEYDIRLYDKEKNAQLERDRLVIAENAAQQLERTTARKSTVRLTQIYDPLEDRLVNISDEPIQRRESLNTSHQPLTSNSAMKFTPRLKGDSTLKSNTAIRLQSMSRHHAVMESSLGMYEIHIVIMRYY